jgi:hypothetical protein
MKQYCLVNMMATKASLDLGNTPVALPAPAGIGRLRAVAIVIPLPPEHPKVHEALTNFRARHFTADDLFQVTVDNSWYGNEFSVVSFPLDYLTGFAESLRMYGLSLVRGTPTLFNDTWHDSYAPGPMLRGLGIDIGGRVFVFEPLPPDGMVLRVGTSLAALRLKN